MISFRVLYWFEGAICIVGLAVITGSGYGFGVNDFFSLSYFPENATDGVMLRSITVPSVKVTHVTAYADLNGKAVAGKSAGHFFIAKLDGTVSGYADRDSWLAACQALNPNFTGDLSRPSRFRSGGLLTVYVALVCLLGLWLFVGLRHLRASQRARKEAEANSTG